MQVKKLLTLGFLLHFIMAEMNIQHNSDQKAIRLDGYLQDSVITNVVSTRSPYPAVAVARENGIQNVTISNVTTPEGVPAVQQV